MAVSFLRSVADHYVAEPNPQNFVFILPNKRSLTFLKRAFCSAASDRGLGAVRMPRFLSVQDFMASLAGVEAADPRELIFILYDAYRNVIPAGQMRDFDSFIFWGNIILSDFDYVDRAMANADSLFTNLKRANEIDAFYLSDRQIKAIRSVWGENSLEIDNSERERFWKHVEYPGGGKNREKHEEFMRFWEILSKLYHEYHAVLRSRSITSPGMQFRLAAENIEKMGDDDFDTQRYVFVGFNDLSYAETSIFTRLRDLGVADFFWDTAPVYMFGQEDEKLMGAPLARLHNLSRKFPMPPGYDIPLPETLPEVTVTAVPSNMGQAKMLHNYLKSNCKAFDINNDSRVTTAIVLPDAGMLLPTVMSIPPEIENVNITMGLSYRSTTFAALLHSIVRMQMNARYQSDGSTYYYEDVINVLSQPHIQTIAPVKARKLADLIMTERLLRPSAIRLTEEEPLLEILFRGVGKNAGPEDATGYLIQLLDWLRDKLEADRVRNDSSIQFFEIEAIAYFRNEIEELSRLFAKYRIELHGKQASRIVFRLFERLFSHRGLTVKGEPVKGLQILGVLETRSLDFDNVVVLSMNESVFPRASYTRTMIPAALRRGSRLPDFQSLEWTYAYCFYRLVARAKHVSLYYDSRNDGQGNGEMSRYITQLANLVPGLAISEKRAVFKSEGRSPESFELEKSPDVQSQVNRLLFNPEDPTRTSPRLSASAIKTFKACPLNFYLQYICGIRSDNELTDYVGADQQGTMVHNIIQSLFDRVRDARGNGGEVEIFESDYGNWLRGDIVALARETLYRVRYGFGKDTENMPVPASYVPDLEEQILIRQIEAIVRADLEAEKKFYFDNDNHSFTYIGSEVTNNNKYWRIGENGPVVRFTMSVDRIDRLKDGRLRFIDFKTGRDKTSCPSSIGTLFSDGRSEYDGILQLLIYSRAYIAAENPEARIIPVIHNMRELSKGEPLNYILSDGDHTYNNALPDEYKSEIDRLICRIFDPSEPFTQASKDKECLYCTFKSLCGRFPKNNF